MQGSKAALWHKALLLAEQAFLLKMQKRPLTGRFLSHFLKDSRHGDLSRQSCFESRKTVAGLVSLRGNGILSIRG
jgi:hypothetical protein